MAPRNVLLVAHAFLPDSHAGVEVYTLRLARGLLARGHAARVLTARLRPGRPQNARLDGVEAGIPVAGIVQNYPYRGLPEAARDPAVDRVVGAVLDEVRPDLVAVQTLAGLGVGVIHEARRRRIRVAVHLHDAWWSCASGGQRRRRDGALCLPVDRALCGACFAAWTHTEGPLERAGRWLAGRLPGRPDALHRGFLALPPAVREGLRTLNQSGALRRVQATPVEHSVGISPAIEARAAACSEALGMADAIVSPTRFLAESLLSDGLVIGRWRHVPTGVPKAPSRRTASPRLRATFLGTLVPHKGPQVFADAVAELPGVQARAVGPAPFAAFAAELTPRSRGALSVEPPLPPEEVPELLAQTDVLVVPSTWAENAPLVVLEARAAGVPVLATDLGGLPELVQDGVDGRLIPAGDAVALRAWLTAWIGDRGQLERLAATVRPPPSLDAWIDGVEEAWEQGRSP